MKKIREIAAWLTFTASTFSAAYGMFKANQIAFNGIGIFDQSPILQRMLQSLSVGVQTFTILWVLAMITPLLVIFVLGANRIKEPKLIIRMGERFHKLSLTTPILYACPRLKFLKSIRLIGIPDMPRPFSGILIGTKETADELFCQQATYQNLGGDLQTIMQTSGIITFGILIRDLSTIPLEIIFSGPMPETLQMTWNIFALVTMSLAIIAAHRRRIYNLDYRTIRVFNLNPESYFSILKQSGISLKVIQRRQSKFESSLIMDKKTSYELPPLRSLRVTKIATSIIALSLGGLWLSVVVKNSREKSSSNYSTRFSLNTQLHQAARTGNLQMIYQLTLAGAQLNEVDENNQNSLFYALEAPTPLQTVSYILQGKMNINQLNRDLKTPLDIAREKNLVEVEKLLLAAGAASALDLTQPPLAPPTHLNEILEKPKARDLSSVHNTDTN